MRVILLALLLSSFLFTLQAQTAEEAIAKMKADFAAMKQTQQDDFDAYKKALETEYKAYKKELQMYWDNPELSTKTKWVSYSKDKKSRSSVDFENNTVTVETVASSEEEAELMLKKSLTYAVVSDTKKVVNTDPLQRKIATLPKGPKVVSSKVDAKPILSTVVFDKKPTKEAVKSYVTKRVKKETIKKSPSKLPNKSIYKVTIALPKNTTLKRSKVYEQEVKTNAQKFELPIPLIFAIIQTESNFNPFAKSHIPAFGLMQIVPKTAGVDTYKFLHKSDRMPSANYLYNGENNIELGSTYLHILYYRYLKKIKDPTSRMYCTIAAYNTGAGNIAYAFTKKYNMNRAAPIINKLSSQEVYSRLLADLRFDEPKHYLKRVNKRMSAFNKAY